MRSADDLVPVKVKSENARAKSLKTLIASVVALHFASCPAMKSSFWPHASRCKMRGILEAAERKPLFFPHSFNEMCYNLRMKILLGIGCGTDLCAKAMLGKFEKREQGGN